MISLVSSHYVNFIRAFVDPSQLPIRSHAVLVTTVRSKNEYTVYRECAEVIVIIANLVCQWMVAININRTSVI